MRRASLLLVWLMACSDADPRDPGPMETDTPEEDASMAEASAMDAAMDEVDSALPDDDADAASEAGRARDAAPEPEPLYCERIEDLAGECGTPTRRLSAGSDHTCAIGSDARAYCWGFNGSGQLGDGGMVQRAAPGAVSFLSDVVDLSAGTTHSCAVLRNGEAYCWGANTNDWLGDGSAALRAAPVPVVALTDAVQISAGATHTCAVRAGGDVSCWGENSGGKLGEMGTTERRSASTVVEGLPPMAQVSAGDHHTCAAARDGNTWCWGSNANGRLGDGTTADRATPRQVVGLSEVVRVAAGVDHSCAVTASGGVWCWGSNAGASSEMHPPHPNGRPRSALLASKTPSASASTLATVARRRWQESSGAGATTPTAVWETTRW